MKLLNSQNLKKFDPFDRVILSTKGIDNSILTSLRTLAKLNNSISDTFKVVHSKFAPTVTKNPCFAYRKEVPMAEKSYSVHPPLDMSVLADSNHMRSFSMGPPLKGVYKQMIKNSEIVGDLPQIDQINNRRGFMGNSKAPFLIPPNLIHEADESQFTLTGRAEIEPTEVLTPDVETALNSTLMSAVPKQVKLSEGKGGGFRVCVKDKQSKDSNLTTHRKNKPKGGDKTIKLSKQDAANFLSEIGVRNTSHMPKQHKKSNSVIPTVDNLPTGNVLQGNKNTVRGLIDQMYQREKKYIKQYFKEDYIQQNDFIFNLDKTHKLRLAKTKEENSSYMPPPISYKSKEEEKRVMLVNGFNV